MKNNKRIVACLSVLLCICLCGCSFPIKNIVQSIFNQEKESDTTRYQDDYYDYMTKSILDRIELPPTNAQWTWFGEVGAIANNNLDDIVDEVIHSNKEYEKGTTEQKIKDLYECIIYLEKQNDINLEPVEKYILQINSATSIQQYIDAIVNFSSEVGFSSIIGGYQVKANMKNSNIYSVYLRGPDTLIGKQFLENDSTKDYCDIYFEYVKNCFEEYGMDKEEAQNAEEDVEFLLKEICSFTLSTQEYYDPSITYNEMSKDDLKKIYTNVDIDKLLSDLQIDQVDTYILEDVSQAKKVNDLLVEENLEALKNYSTFVCLNDIGNYASKNLRKLQKDCYNQLHGITQDISVEEQAIDDVQKLLAWDFAKIYVKNNFSKESKENVEKMIDDIISEYKEVINRQAWMCEETKKKAIEKLDSMVVKIGYPKEWPSACDKLQIQPLSEGGSYLKTIVVYSALQGEESRKKIGHNVDKNEWVLTPQTVNASYDPTNNEIDFPAAILQPPFYNADADYAINLGGIGYIIAHEISHAFDSTGALYDKDGNYNPWWTEEEEEEYNKLTEDIIEYYNQYEYMGVHVDGELTKFENIADLSAMTCITSILQDDTKQLSEMFSQLAFVWANEQTKEYALYQLANDVHAPNKIRINAVLSSCDEFYETYDIKSTDQMYVEPEKRVGIWK